VRFDQFTKIDQKEIVRRVILILLFLFPNNLSLAQEADCSDSQLASRSRELFANSNATSMPDLGILLDRATELPLGELINELQQVIDNLNGFDLDYDQKRQVITAAYLGIIVSYLDGDEFVANMLRRYLVGGGESLNLADLGYSPLDVSCFIDGGGDPFDKILEALDIDYFSNFPIHIIIHGERPEELAGVVTSSEIDEYLKNSSGLEVEITRTLQSSGTSARNVFFSFEIRVRGILTYVEGQGYYVTVTGAEMSDRYSFTRQADADTAMRIPSEIMRMNIGDLLDLLTPLAIVMPDKLNEILSLLAIITNEREVTLQSLHEAYGDMQVWEFINEHFPAISRITAEQLMETIVNIHIFDEQLAMVGVPYSIHSDLHAQSAPIPVFPTWSHEEYGGPNMGPVELIFAGSDGLNEDRVWNERYVDYHKIQQKGNN
jgi:hypothetical protein